jgi:hypothetical protein
MVNLLTYIDIIYIYSYIYVNNNNFYEKVNLSSILNMTKLFRKIVIPVFCLICGFYVKQKLVNLYNLDVSLLIDYLLVYIPATISNSIISFILDDTKLLSYMMSSGNGDNASNIGEINAGNVTGDNTDKSNNTGNSNDTDNSVHGDGNNSDNDGNNSDNSSTPDLEDDSNDLLQDIRDANEEREELSDDPEATTGDKVRADIRLQKAMITSLESMLETEPNNETAQSMLVACMVILSDLESQLDYLDSDDE